MAFCQLNFRPGASGKPSHMNETFETCPTTAPSTVKEVILTLVMRVCKKTLFYDVNLRIALYLGSLFLISLIGDFVPYPKTYFAHRENILNIYFVKMGWAWTLFIVGPFMFMASYTLCCGAAHHYCYGLLV